MKHIFLFISVAIITYFLISLATMDMAWYMHNTPWIWIAVIPFFFFLYMIQILSLHEEMEFKKQMPDGKANYPTRTLQERLPDTVHRLVGLMGEIREDIKAVKEEQSRIINVLLTDVCNVMKRREELLNLERRINRRKGVPMLLTKNETASLLLVNYSTLRRWKKKGILVPIRITPHHELYSYSDILKILESKNESNTTSISK